MADEEKWAAFQLRMKNATRSVHDLQDKTITGMLYSQRCVLNSTVAILLDKLGLFAATLYFGGSQDLWYQALARFELVFNELEDCLDCQKKLSAWDIPGMRVSQYIKEDLDAYYGKERKFSSAAVNTWIAEIRKIRFDQPLLVTAYIYHMYLGLYSGGRILRHKFKLKGKTLELDPKLNVRFNWFKTEC